MDTPKSLRFYPSQRILAVVSARALYSASVLEQATRVCFLLRQEIREEPRRKQYLVVDLQSLGYPAQLALENARRIRGD